MANPNKYAQNRTSPNASRDSAMLPATRTNRMNPFDRVYRRSLAVLGFICASLVLVAGCHKGSAFAVSISIVPGTAQSLDAGHSQNFTAIVAGDSQNKGVKWTLTLNSNVCSSGTGATCGTLSAATTTSVTYTAPNVSGTTSITLTATSVADPTATSTVTINIQLAPQFVASQTIPPAAENGVPYSATIKAQDGVAPLTFSLVNPQSAPLPDGLTLNPNSGVIAGTPTFTGTTPQTYKFSLQVTDFNGVSAATPLALAITVSGPPGLSATSSLPQGFVGGQYTGTISPTGGVPPLTFALAQGSGPLPAGLLLNSTSGIISGVPTTMGTSNFAVTITDSAVPIHQSFTLSSLSITVSQPPTLTIITQTLQAGTAGSGYSQLVQAQGGIPPYTWTLVSGQLPAGLSLSTNSNDSTGLISGTPILQDASGFDSTFTLGVTDSSSSPRFVTQQFTLPISSSATNLNSLLTGTYAFFFQGLDGSGPVSIAGTLTMDGAGNITSGLEDSNRISGIKQGATLTGSYKIGLNGADGRGTLHLVANPGTQSELDTDFILILESDGSVRMIENNKTNTNNDGSNNTHGFGLLRPVTQSGFSASSLSGNYAFMLTGEDFGAKQEALGGIFHANGVSQLSPVAGDINDNGSFAQILSPSGTFSFSTMAQRGTATLLYALSGKSQTQLQFAFYFASSSDVFFVETDVPTNTDQFPRLSGEARLQQTNATFGQLSFSGTSVLTGTGLDGNNSSALAGLLTAPYVPANLKAFDGCDGVTTDVSLKYDQDDGGTVTQSIAPAATTCTVNSNGRATFGNIDPRIAVAYLTGPGQGFVLGSDAAVTTGQIELQTSAPFAQSEVVGTYALSSSFPRDTKTAGFLGQFAAPKSSPGNLTGTLDEIDYPGNVVFLGQPNPIFNIASPDPVTGRGMMTSSSQVSQLSANFVFYMVSPTSIRILPFDNNPGNTHPGILTLDH